MENKEIQQLNAQEQEILKNLIEHKKIAQQEKRDEKIKISKALESAILKSDKLTPKEKVEALTALNVENSASKVSQQHLKKNQQSKDKAKKLNLEKHIEKTGQSLKSTIERGLSGM